MYPSSDWMYREYKWKQKGYTGYWKKYIDHVYLQQFYLRYVFPPMHEGMMPNMTIAQNQFSMWNKS